jgi:hypothetical protein
MAFNMQRRKFLPSVGASVLIGFAGCSGGGDRNSSEIEIPAKWNDEGYEGVRTPSMSEGVSFVSDDETQYAGVQLSVMNETGGSDMFVTSVEISEDRTRTRPEVILTADETDDNDILLHAKSECSSLENVDAGETVEATLLYACTPKLSDYTRETKGRPNHTYEITENGDLEIDLVDLSDS